MTGERVLRNPNTRASTCRDRCRAGDAARVAIAHRTPGAHALDELRFAATTHA